MAQKQKRGKILGNIALGIGLLIGLLVIFWLARNMGIGEFVSVPQTTSSYNPLVGLLPSAVFYQVSVEGVKVIYLSGIVSGMALTLFIIILGQLLYGLDKYFRIGLRWKIWKRQFGR